MKLRRLAAAFMSVTLLLAFYISPAAAHDPVFLSERHSSPEVGPLLPDGTISFALYGRLLSPAATQGFQAGMKSGETLNLSLLIPAVPPETSFELVSLPEVQVVRPDGTEFLLTPTMREMFHEPYTNTRYLRLADHQEVAQQGYYNFVVSGERPGRYVVSIGTLERFGTEIIRYTRPLIVGRSTQPLFEWFEESVELDQPTTGAVADVGEEMNEEPPSQQDNFEVESSGAYVSGETEQVDGEEPCDCGRSRRWLIVGSSVVLLLVALAVLKVRRRRSISGASEVST